MLLPALTVAMPVQHPVLDALVRSVGGLSESCMHACGLPAYLFAGA